MNLVDNADAKHESASSPALLAALTTKHYTLQAPRSSTMVEANGRSTLSFSATRAATVLSPWSRSSTTSVAPSCCSSW
jgi:hypothetical protein